MDGEGWNCPFPVFHGSSCLLAKLIYNKLVATGPERQETLTYSPWTQDPEMGFGKNWNFGKIWN